LYLADTSIWAWAKRRDDIRAKLGERVARRQLATCTPVALEVLQGARNRAEYEEELGESLAPLDWIPLSSEAGDRALEVQRLLSRTTDGAHRIPAVDYLVAAVAERAGADMVLWHFDRDLGRICDLIDHPHEEERLPRRRRGAR
jgi:predicted nucleic acid-binding protein